MVVMDLETAIDECLQYGMSSGKYPSLVIGVSTLDDRCVRGAGGSDAGTLFELGSITKVFTGLALAVSTVRGEVTLDEPVAKLLPGVDLPGGDAIGLRHLATHTSGLPRLPAGLLRATRGNLRDPYAMVDADWLYASLARTPLRFWRQPGRRHRYSNLGMGLLGHALARRVTGGPDTRGEDYERMLRDRVCTPLGLADTVIRPSEEQRERLAPGHSAAGKPASHWDLAALAGAGALRSTATDMLTFLDAQLEVATHAADGVPAELAEAMALSQQVHYSGRRQQVGLAWLVSRRIGPEAYWHDGGTGGGASVAGFVPAGRLALVILANRARPVWRLALKLLRALGVP
jgi:CubicO group peptidase (beta-lactamase class C family)